MFQIRAFWLKNSFHHFKCSKNTIWRVANHLIGSHWYSVSSSCFSISQNGSLRQKVNTAKAILVFSKEILRMLNAFGFVLIVRSNDIYFLCLRISKAALFDLLLDIQQSHSEVITFDKGHTHILFRQLMLTEPFFVRDTGSLLAQ